MDSTSDATPTEETSVNQDSTSLVPIIPPTELKPRPWSKKKSKPRKAKSKRHGIPGRKWTWGHVNTFRSVRHWSRRARLIRPTTRDTIPGCIYYAMKRLGRATDHHVHQAALADGLASLTVQPTYSCVQRELRYLAKLGVIKRTKHPKRKTS